MDLTGTVFVRGRSKLHVQFQSGALAFAVLEAGVQQGRAYLIKRSSDATPAPIRVTGTAAATVKRFNSRTIGVP